MLVWRLELPYPPSVNKYYRAVGRGIKISKCGRDYRSTIIQMLKGRIPYPLKKLLSVKIFLFPSRGRGMDVDNCLKGLLDALQHAKVYINDNLIDKLSVHRDIKVPGGAVVIYVHELAKIQRSSETLGTLPTVSYRYMDDPESILSGNVQVPLPSTGTLHRGSTRRKRRRFRRTVHRIGRKVT